MQFLLNFTEFACGGPLPFGNLLKGLKQLLVLLQKVIGLPFKYSIWMEEAGEGTLTEARRRWF
jgi:hypothetical protein